MPTIGYSPPQQQKENERLLTRLTELEKQVLELKKIIAQLKKDVASLSGIP